MNATRAPIAPWMVATVMQRWLGLGRYGPMVWDGVLVDSRVRQWRAFQRCPHPFLASGAA